MKGIRILKSIKRKMFGGGPKIWLDQFDEKHDFPVSTEVVRRFAICSTPRSGSHMLGHLLYSTGNFGYPLEYFNPYNAPYWQERAGSKNYLRYLESIRTSANGCFGIKLHWGHMTSFQKWGDSREGNLLSKYAIIFIKRRNKLSQAVSAAKASQTASYISDVESVVEPVYDRMLIMRKLKQTLSDEAAWSLYFSVHGCEFLEIYFEDILENPQSIVNLVSKHIFMDESSSVVNKEFLKNPQSDVVNRDWEKRFLLESESDNFLKNF